MSNETLEVIEREISDAVLNFGSLDESIELFGEVWQMKETTRFPNDEWVMLKDLIQRFGDYLVDKLSNEAYRVLNQTGDRYYIADLIRVRDQLKSELLPQWIRKKLQPKLSQVYVALNNNSKQEAIALVNRVNSCLEEIGINALNENLTFAVRLSEVRLLSARVFDMLEKIPPHIMFVGLPAVAKEMSPETTAEAVINDLKSRAVVLQVVILELEDLVYFEAEHAEEIRAEKLAQLRRGFEKAQQKKAQAEREQMLNTFKNRDINVFEAAKQFYHNLSLGRPDVAWGNLQTIRRLDGGIPVMMQTDYHKAVAQQTPLRDKWA